MLLYEIVCISYCVITHIVYCIHYYDMIAYLCHHISMVRAGSVSYPIVIIVQSGYRMIVFSVLLYIRILSYAYIYIYIYMLFVYYTVCIIISFVLTGASGLRPSACTRCAARSMYHNISYYITLYHTIYTIQYNTIQYNTI